MTKEKIVDIVRYNVKENDILFVDREALEVDALIRWCWTNNIKHTIVGVQVPPGKTVADCIAVASKEIGEFTFPDHKTGPTKTVVFDQENCTAAKEANNIQSVRPPLTEFEQDLRRLINKHCVENLSNTPDFILAEYLSSCLYAFNFATNRREQVVWMEGSF